MGGMVFVFCFAYKHTSSNIKNMNGVKGYYVLQPWKLAFVGDDSNVASFAFTICWEAAAAALGYCIVAFALLCCTLHCFVKSLLTGKKKLVIKAFYLRILERIHDKRGKVVFCNYPKKSITVFRPTPSNLESLDLWERERARKVHLESLLSLVATPQKWPFGWESYKSPLKESFVSCCNPTKVAFWLPLSVGLVAAVPPPLSSQSAKISRNQASKRNISFSLSGANIIMAPD